MIRTLYIFDEPTTGLHFDDVSKLLAAFRRLIDAGGSILVIEHNLEVIKTADWVIDLGPEGGERGGHLVGAGPPEDDCELPDSYTGQFLAHVLSRQEESVGARRRHMAPVCEMTFEVMSKPVELRVDRCLGARLMPAFCFPHLWNHGSPS